MPPRPRAETAETAPAHLDSEGAVGHEDPAARLDVLAQAAIGQADHRLARGFVLVALKGRVVGAGRDDLDLCWCRIRTSEVYVPETHAQSNPSRSHPMPCHLVTSQVHETTLNTVPSANHADVTTVLNCNPSFAPPIPTHHVALLDLDALAALEHGSADLGPLGVQHHGYVLALGGRHLAHAVQHLRGGKGCAEGSVARGGRAWWASGRGRRP